MVTGPMPSIPNATSPNAKIDGYSMFKLSNSGENMYPMNINITKTKPVQKPEKLPATKPDNILSDAPPCSDALTTSFTCEDFGEVNILVISGIIAAPNVPQEIMVANIHQRSVFPLRFPIRKYDVTNVPIIDRIDVIHTRLVRGASKSNSSFLP